MASIHKCILFSVTGVSLLMICACGGGSSGTGGRRFEGTVVSTDNRRLADVVVTITETNESTTTNSQGFYSLDSELPEGTATYIFQGADFTAMFTLENISPNAVTISVDFQIDIEEDNADPTRIEIEEDDRRPEGDDSHSVDDDSSGPGSGSDDDTIDDDSSGPGSGSDEPDEPDNDQEDL